MPGVPVRDKETQDLVRRFQAQRERRRRTRVVLYGLGGLVVVALIAAVVLLVVRGPGDDSTGGAAGTAGSPAPTGSTAPAGSTVTSIAGGVTGSSATTGVAESSTTTHAATTSSSVATTATGASTTTAVGASTTATTGKPTTTSQASTTTAASPTTSAPASHGGAFVVVIDPGHQAKANTSTEPVGPGSSEYKAKVSGGTAGVVTGTPESELVLTVSLKLRDALEAHGIEVVMTRTSQNVDISNIERAQLANDAGADLFVRIHADGSEDSSISGIHVLYPASIAGWTDDIAKASKEAAALAQRELIAATGARDRGLDARSDMTGFNWSDVPVILPEIGFMTNAAEDRLLATAAYQDKIVAGLTRAILGFLGAG